jgi:hypothetical protein
MMSLKQCNWAKGTFALLIALSISGCASTGGTYHPAGKALEFPQFIVVLPPAPDWTESSWPNGGKIAGRVFSPTHTLAASVAYSELDPSLRIHDRDDPVLIAKRAVDRFYLLNTVVKEIRRSGSSEGQKITFFDSDVYENTGADACISYDFTGQHRDVLGQPSLSLVFMVLGRVCVRNDLNIVTRIEYSERRLSDELPLAQFKEEAMVFLNGFQKRE